MKGIVRSLLVSLWFMILTFPLLVIKVNPASGQVAWRWENMILIGVGIFFLSFVWRGLLVRKGMMTAEAAGMTGLFNFLATPGKKESAWGLVLLLLAAAPFTLYGVDVVTGLEARLSTTSLVFAAICFVCAVGCLLGKRKPVLDAVTRAGDTLSHPGAPRFAALGLGLAALCVFPYLVDVYQISVLTQAFIWIMLGLGLNIVVGQAGLLVLGYVAREDEIACEAMGIDRVGVKLMAFGLGTAWAGFAGVIFAAKTTFINPASFTFFESAIILSIVVLGGMGLQPRESFSARPFWCCCRNICALFRIPHDSVRRGHGRDDGFSAAGADPGPSARSYDRG
jgi:branched-chain amino acid transport system permease protein